MPSKQLLRSYEVSNTSETASNAARLAGSSLTSSTPAATTADIACSGLNETLHLTTEALTGALRAQAPCWNGARTSCISVYVEVMKEDDMQYVELGETVHSWLRHVHEKCLAGRLQPTGQTETPIQGQSSSAMHVLILSKTSDDELASNGPQTLRTRVKKRLVQGYSIGIECTFQPRKSTTNDHMTSTKAPSLALGQLQQGLSNPM
jgi:hypothetical protein